MRLLEGHDDSVAKFVADFSPVERPEWDAHRRAFGIINDRGELVAGVVFSGWHPRERRVELSGVSLSRYAFRPPILAALGEYAFGQLGAFRVWARTSVDNRPARSMLKHLGFTEESTQAHWYGESKHAVTARVIRPDWEKSCRRGFRERDAAPERPTAGRSRSVCVITPESPMRTAA